MMTRLFNAFYIGLLAISTSAMPQVAIAQDDSSGLRKRATTPLVESIVEEMRSLDVDKLPAIPVRPYQLPTPSIDVMRVRLTETYDLHGIGKDSVDLIGWIAVKHDNTRPIDSSRKTAWNNSVTDTEFVAMELVGKSEKLGDVKVTLNSENPVFGQVGFIDLPTFPLATVLSGIDGEDPLAAENDSPEKDEAEKDEANKDEANKDEANKDVANKDEANKDEANKDDTPRSRLFDVERAKRIKERVRRSKCCRAAVSVNIELDSLGIKVKTKTPVSWYSFVDTIPPVGKTASVTRAPVDLVDTSGRVIGRLQSGRVNFREVIRIVPLPTDDSPIDVAQKSR